MKYPLSFQVKFLTYMINKVQLRTLFYNETNTYNENSSSRRNLCEQTL